mgnify:CR=1 FL=1
MSRRLFSALGAVPALVVAISAVDARASVSIAATWDGLMHESTAAAVMSPVESQAVWENGRIYTYTRLGVDRAVAGDLATGASAWVRTLGGVVGKIGQVVEGEAVFTPGHSSLLFLHPGPAGTFEVTARGQGQFPVIADDPKVTPKVVRSNAMGFILPRAATTPASVRIAAEVIHGRALDDVAHEIAGDWDRTHRP